MNPDTMVLVVNKNICYDECLADAVADKLDFEYIGIPTEILMWQSSGNVWATVTVEVGWTVYESQDWQSLENGTIVNPDEVK